MIPFEDFKKMMPKEEKLTDKQILELRGQMEELVDIAFDMWIEDKRKNTKTNSEVIE